MSTKIEWTDETWNPLIGCSEVSPGCNKCYAKGVVHRGMSPQHVGLTVRSEGETQWTGEVREVPHMLDRPLHWRKPKRVFVNSLSDLFHPDVSIGYIAQVFAVMAEASQHQFQVLTKRPQRMATVLADAHFWAAFWRTGVHDRTGLTVGDLPLSNVWLGTSIELDRYAFRADHLRATPAAVRFISAEPLLGPLPSLDLTGIDWLIVGGESGHGARPMHPDWVRDLRDRCGSTAFLFKQWGHWRSFLTPADGWPDVDLYMHVDGRTATEDEALADGGSWQGMYRLGKGSAGRDIDGRTWDEFPVSAQVQAGTP